MGALGPHAMVKRAIDLYFDDGELADVESHAARHGLAEAEHDGNFSLSEYGSCRGTSGNRIGRTGA